MALGQQGHRAGPLKQTNKSHKTGRHRSKGSIDNALKGKTSAKVVTKKNYAAMRRDQRRHQSNQIRQNKRDEAFSRKRTLGISGAAPYLVTILPLNMQIDPNSALYMLEKCDPDAIVSKTSTGITHITIPRFKQNFTFIIPPLGRGKEINVLDCLKVSDTTLLLLSATCGDEQYLDNWGKKVINMSIAQGLPTPTVCLMDLESINPKKRNQIKSEVQKVIQKSLPEEKPMNLDTDANAFNLLRRIGGQKKNVLYNKYYRPHLYGENVEYVSDDISSVGTLQITGFLRGQPLNVNQLIHIPGLGDFQMSEISLTANPHKCYNDFGNLSLADSKLSFKSNPENQVSLTREILPDQMDAEQTFPTEEEIAQSREQNKKSIKKVPKGMSDYQAAWIPEFEAGNENSEEDEEEEDENSGDEYMSCKSNESSDLEFAEQGDEEEFDTISVSEAPVNDEKYDHEMDLEEEKLSLQKIKEARTDALWPDEVDTPNDLEARKRFIKYRGLESFRTSPWDIKENLPYDYGRIFQFQNFDRTKRRIIKEIEDKDGAMPGWYITVHVKNVPKDLWNMFKREYNINSLILYGMLPHENQMSVMNVILKRTPDSTVPIKSKEKLIFQCGYRRFIVNPIFSQHTNGGKHKYERFFRENSIVVATFYAPIQFPPAPILCFRENPDTTLGLVATGSLMSCTPDRIILKRIVLSGHPFKINRRSATVRYMFFNKDDVNYFKPIRLRTRCGRLGHIKESLGTHGHMKCQFDGQIKSYDTVHLYLYKRVFPKWTYEDCIIRSSILENLNNGKCETLKLNENKMQE